MTALHFVVEQTAELRFVHSFAVVLDCYFHIIVGLLATDHHPTAFRRELPRIVGHRVDHEQRQDAVGLHHVVGGLYHQFYIPKLKSHTASGYNVENILQAEGLYLERQLPLLQLNPLSQNGIVLVYLFCYFCNIMVTASANVWGFLSVHQARHLVGHTVDQRCHTVHKKHFRTILHIASLVVLYVQTTHRAGLIHLFIFLI